LGDTAKGPLAGLVRIMPIDRLNAIMAITPNRVTWKKFQLGEPTGSL
jgi:hypothetical protein